MAAKGGKGGKGKESEQERQLRFEIERMKEEEAARAKEAARRDELKKARDAALRSKIAAAKRMSPRGVSAGVVPSHDEFVPSHVEADRDAIQKLFEANEDGRAQRREDKGDNSGHEPRRRTCQHGTLSVYGEELPFAPSTYDLSSLLSHFSIALFSQ